MLVMKKFVHQVVKVDDYDIVMHCRDDLAHISISQQFLATISFPKSSETGD